MAAWPLRVALAGAMGVASLLTPLAYASGLQVSPIGLRLTASSSAEAMWLANTGNETLHAQVRVYRWSQVGGKDTFEPSSDLVVSPPMITVAPGDRQLVRVIRQVQPPADGIESAYRVLVDELPVTGSGKTGLTFVLRYSVPVFVEPAGDTSLKATLEATWDEAADGPHLLVHNSGNGHAQIADLTWQASHGPRKPLLPGLVGYALPGATMSWKLPADARHTDGTVRARVNGESSETTLVVDAGGR